MLDEMRTFVLLAEEGSIQKVAERLPLTQPAVTRQIQRLEQALGAALLDRRMKPPGLTPFGVEALARSRQILAAYDDMKNLTARAEPEGLLRLGVATGLADDGFARIVGDIRQRFPQVALRLTTGWSDGLAEQFEQGYLDAAFLLSRGRTNDDSAMVGEEPLAIIASSKTALKKRDRARTLEGQPWILSPEPCDARSRLTAAMARKGYQLNIAAEVQDARLQLALVRKGVGLSLMPRRLLTTPPSGITVVQIDGLDLMLDIRVRRSPHLRGLGKVVDLIAEQLRSSVRN
ncbi:hypothetical protein ASD45_02425 [Pseudolabrys sp. Root1462]|jgi:DNA-binding transcriptional LysR family regulator|uniref:LysR family transcriptional regulator n=1 Tax=Pseudolabrys sp. Root1462 TaxID=1736466 RepID=UPI00070275F6|nr:LysR family transcriptional regulator [Pseudolabrys sp. Root1462]KQY99775.1 hypothetical protein ASD45_02425 [Pseudolabrys sp. Root1462]